MEFKQIFFYKNCWFKPYMTKNDTVLKNHSLVTSNTLNILLLNTVLKYGLESLHMRLHKGILPALARSSMSQISGILQPGLKIFINIISKQRHISFNERILYHFYAGQEPSQVSHLTC